MTLPEVKAMLDTLDIGVKYRHSKKKLPTPFIVYYRNKTDPFYADGRTYHTSTPITIELYEDEINMELENKLESLLDEHGLAYKKDEEWIDSENMYQIIYEIEV